MMTPADKTPQAKSIPMLTPEQQEFLNDAARLLSAGYDRELILRSVYSYAYFNGALDYARIAGEKHSI